MAFAAGLGVVEGSQAVGDGFSFLKPGLIGGVRGVVDHAIRLIVKTGWSFRKRRSEQKDRKYQQGQTHEELHRHLVRASGRPILAKAE